MSFAKEYESDSQEDEEVKYEASKLDKQTENFVNFINDKQQMEKNLKEVGYDIKKMPLGKLSDQTVKDGYSILTKLVSIHRSIKEKKSNFKDKSDEITTLTNQFYSTIPHDYGRGV